MNRLDLCRSLTWGRIHESQRKGGRERWCWRGTRAGEKEGQPMEVTQKWC
jgi:hypothetical protein